MAKVTTRGDRYVLDYYDDKGERVRKTMKAGTTKKAARDRLREIEEQLARGTYIPDKRVPTFQKTAEDWLKLKKTNLRASTWAVYEGITRNHFEDFNELRVDRVTTAAVEQYIADRMAAGMPIATVRKLLVVLGQILKYAVRHRHIHQSPVLNAERPRGQGQEKKPIRVLAPPEIQKLLDAVEDKKYRTLFMLAIMSGARQGELFGLKWGDVDWQNRQIHIQRTFNNQAWYDAKTKASRRRIDIGPRVVKELRRWKLACPPNELDLVFPNEAGGPLNHNNVVSRHFEPALKKAGIERARFHDMRHTYASLLIEQGENLKYIQTQMGHSSPTVTLNTYAHLLKPANQEAMARLDGTVFGQPVTKRSQPKTKGLRPEP